MERLGNAVMKCLEVVIVGLISVMSILVIVNVALRFFFSSSIVVSEELSRFMFIYIVFLGSIVALKEDGHIYVDFIAKAFPRPIQWVLKLVVNCCMLYCCYVLLLGSVELSEYNMVDKSPVAGIPMGYIYFAGAIGAAGMGIVLIIRIIRHITSFSSWLKAAPAPTATPADAATAADAVPSADKEA